MLDVDVLGLFAESLTTIMEGEGVIMQGQDTISASVTAVLTKISALQTVGMHTLLIGFGVVGVLAAASIIIGYLNSRKLDEIRRELDGARR